MALLPKAELEESAQEVLRRAEDRRAKRNGAPPASAPSLLPDHWSLPVAPVAQPHAGAKPFVARIVSGGAILVEPSPAAIKARLFEDRDAMPPGLADLCDWA
jgi:hypothetical protein